VTANFNKQGKSRKKKQGDESFQAPHKKEEDRTHLRSPDEAKKQRGAEKVRLDWGKN